MALACVYSRARLGLDSPLVTVEVHLANGLPAFHIVGLPETSVKEAKDRVRSALINCGFEFPAKRITVNLAPADLPKEGARFDLPIAVGILSASNQLTGDLSQYEFAGELALSGELRPIVGEIPMAMASVQHSKTVFLPKANAEQASWVSEVKIHALEHLMQLHQHFSREHVLPLVPLNTLSEGDDMAVADIADVVGQPMAKRALEISASGAHNLLFIGPPGTGKTMLASRLPGILPPMTEAEALETAALHSICSQPIKASRWLTRPFRAPHHTASAAALVGGCNLH